MKDNSPAIAVVGCGTIAGRFQTLEENRTYSHAKAIRSVFSTVEIGFYDLVPRYAIEMAEKYQGTNYSNIESMLENLNPDIVSICSPDEYHFEQIVQIIQSRYSPQIIFVEKPICLLHSELETIINLQAEHPEVSIFVNHSRRFDTKHREVAKAIKLKRYGSFESARIDYYGGWIHYGVHLVDFFDLCFSSNIEVNSASFAYDSKHSGDETIHIEGLLEKRPIKFFGHDEEFYQISEIDMFFEKGRILISDFGMHVDYYEKGINTEHENVLFHEHHCSGPAMFDQMISAYKEFSCYLDDQKSNILDSVSLKHVENVMKNLWRVKGRYEELSN